MLWKRPSATCLSVCRRTAPEPRSYERRTLPFTTSSARYSTLPEPDTMVKDHKGTFIFVGVILKNFTTIQRYCPLITPNNKNVFSAPFSIPPRQHTSNTEFLNAVFHCVVFTLSFLFIENKSNQSSYLQGYTAAGCSAATWPAPGRWSYSWDLEEETPYRTTPQSHSCPLRSGCHSHLREKTKANLELTRILKIIVRGGSGMKFCRDSKKSFQHSDDTF